MQKLFTELETYQQNITTLEETQSRCEFIKQQIELNKQEIAQLQKHSQELELQIFQLKKEFDFYKPTQSQEDSIFKKDFLAKAEQK